MTDSKQHSTTQQIQKCLVCRYCGCQHFHVLSIRPASSGRLLIRRICRYCGRRITRYEQTGGHKTR